MANPLGAILAGLGGGLSSAGQSMDERARLALQNKRQSALDAIARAQKLDEMGLTADDPNGSPFANPGALAPASIPLQTGMDGGTNTPPPAVNPSDVAMKQLFNLPNATGGTDTFRKKTASELSQDPKAVYEAQKQQAELGRITAANQQQDTFRQNLADHSAALQQKAAQDNLDRTERGAYAVLAASFPNSPIIKASPTFQQGISYTKALNDEQEVRKANTMTPYQTGMLGVARQNAATRGQAAAVNQGKQTPDQIKSQTVLSLSDPAAQILLDYKGGGGAADTAANAVTGIPLLGRTGLANAITGKISPAFQNAHNAAVTLATQYLEIMPKSRFQPSTIDEVVKQIEPNPGGDAPLVAASKLARVKALRDAIRSRAHNATANTGLVSLDDAPEPPGGG